MLKHVVDTVTKKTGVSIYKWYYNVTCTSGGQSKPHTLKDAQLPPGSHKQTNKGVALF